MSWDKDWTIESVENNYRVLGMVDPEDIEQLIADAKELRDIKKHKDSRYEESNWDGGTMADHFRDKDY